MAFKKGVFRLVQGIVYHIVINQSRHHFFVLFFKLPWFCRMSYYLVLFKVFKVCLKFVGIFVGIALNLLIWG